jgi:uncharacterized damage-inducible protein DinB
MNDADKAILDHFTVARDKTLELLERVPAEWLTRQAEGEKHTLGQLFAHIADGPNWWLANVAKDGRGWRPPSTDHRDPAALRQALEASRQRMLDFFAADEGRRMGQEFTFTEREGIVRRYVGRDRVLYLTDHEVHHRGKIVLALRQWGHTDIPFMPYRTG